MEYAWLAVRSLSTCLYIINKGLVKSPPILNFSLSNILGVEIIEPEPIYVPPSY